MQCACRHSLSVVAVIIAPPSASTQTPSFWRIPLGDSMVGLCATATALGGGLCALAVAGTTASP